MRISIVYALSALVAGCTVGRAEEPRAADPPPGEEIPVSTLPPAEAAPIPEAPEPAPPEPSGPGRLRIEVRLGTDVHDGAVRVRDAAGAEVAVAHDGDELELPTGAYTLTGRITDPAQLVDQPERTSEPVELAPEGRATARLVFGRARVRVLVTSRGRPLPSAVVKLHRARTTEVVVEHPADGRYVPLSPGRYDLYVTDRGHTVQANDIALQNGASQTIPVTFE